MDNKKVLIIHLSRMGDMVQSLAAIKRLKEKDPECTIACLGIEEFCDILVNVPWIDNLVTLPWQEISAITNADVPALDRLMETIPELNEEYDLLINLTHSWSSGYLTGKVKAAKKRGRIFSRDNEILVAGNWGKYLFAMAKNQRDNLLNLVDIYMGMLGVENRPAGQFLPTYPEVDRKCLANLSGLGLDAERLSIGLQLGTNKMNKKWPLENFIELGGVLFNHLDAQIILFGSERETELGDQFKESAPYPFINLIGKTTLRELGSYLKGIDVLISNDTGPMHIAAAVGTRVVGIYIGIAYFGVTGPYGAGHVAIQSNYPCAPCLSTSACSNPLCAEGIKPEDVAKGVRLCLGLEQEPLVVDPRSSIYQSSFNADGTLRYELACSARDGFLPWLSSSHYRKAMVSQVLWNNWLGLESDFIDTGTGEGNGQLREILSDFERACSGYKDIYDDGRRLCQGIINEFQKEKPNLMLIQIMVESLRQIQERVEKMEGHLDILTEVQATYMAETEVCEFPKLAHQFRDKFTALKDIVTSFEGSLQRIEAAI